MRSRGGDAPVQQAGERLAMLRREQPHEPGQAADGVRGPVAQRGWVSVAVLAGGGVLAWWAVETVRRIRGGRA